MFSKKKKAEQSLLDVVGKLQDTSNRYKGLGLDSLIGKMQLDTEYHLQWKDIDGMIVKLISMLRYNLNDGNEKTVHTLLGYIGKLVDSRIGFSNYYEQLKDPVEIQLQEYDISMSKYLDEADRALVNLEKDPNKYDIYAFEYKRAVIESKQIAEIMLELSTRVRKADLEREKKIYDAQNISEEIKEKSQMSAFYKEGTKAKTAENIKQNQRRFRNFDAVEIPVSKEVHSPIVPKSSLEISSPKTIIEE